jgi:lysine 2,3-aminomutase
MAIRLTPHILSRIDWANPLDDPIRRQFLPLASGIEPDHEELKLDSLHEEADSRMFSSPKIILGHLLTSTAVPGLVHRYPGRALFLGK